jgi:hypothetical protein
MRILFLEIIVGIYLLLATGITQNAYALPAFAFRENVSCTVCHNNGSAPHLTKTGYLYRRAGFRFPENIGNLEKDKEAMQILNHFSAGANIDYKLTTTHPKGQSKASVTNNEINVGEVQIWPIVGGFLGNYGAWTELDMSPLVASPAGESSPSGGVELSQADLRYIWGTSNNFFNFRAGLIAPEGFGASDQWLDDANLPLMDSLSAQHNGIDTLILPVGALQTPQMGAEIGYNYYNTHPTLGLYNGFDGTNGLQTNTQSSATPGLTNPHARGSKDIKIQVDQFFDNDRYAATAVYYKGKVSLLDQTNKFVFVDSYALGRLYGTYVAIPNVVDILAGAGLGKNDYVNPGSSTLAGSFKNYGAFLGTMYYVKPHLSLAGRFDYYKYASGVNPTPRSIAYVLMASLPYENNIYVFHFNRTMSDLDPKGISNDFRAEWRFLY